MRSGAWMFVAGTVAAMAAGQVLFKIAAARIEVSGTRWMAWLNAPLLAALVVYFLATLLWVAALRALPLRLAYPASASSFILVPVLAHFLLGEPLTARTVLGAATIVAGIAISVSSN